MRFRSFAHAIIAASAIAVTIPPAMAGDVFGPQPFTDVSFDQNSPFADVAQFSGSDYSFNCNSADVVGVVMDGMAPQSHIVGNRHGCLVVNAPVVPISFLTALQTRSPPQGGKYVYQISYPFSDDGTGKAILSYGIMCPSNGGCGCPPGHAGCNLNFVRIVPGDWQDQFPLRSVCIVLGPAGCVQTANRYAMTQPTLNGAENPGYIAINGGTQPPDTYFPDGAVGFTFWWYSSSAPGWEYKTMFDRWLAIPTPLPTPARVASPPPGAINTNANGRAVISFDYNMFCSAPGGDGQPRSSAWIKNCLASLGH